MRVWVVGCVSGALPDGAPCLLGISGLAAVAFGRFFDSIFYLLALNYFWCYFLIWQLLNLFWLIRNIGSSFIIANLGHKVFTFFNLFKFKLWARNILICASRFLHLCVRGCWFIEGTGLRFRFTGCGCILVYHESFGAAWNSWKPRAAVAMLCLNYFCVSHLGVIFTWKGRLKIGWVNFLLALVERGGSWHTCTVRLVVVCNMRTLMLDWFGLKIALIRIVRYFVCWLVIFGLGFHLKLKGVLWVAAPVDRAQIKSHLREVFLSRLRQFSDWLVGRGPVYIQVVHLRVCFVFSADVHRVKRFRLN